MKRMFALLLSVSLMFSVCACVSQNNKDNTNEQNDATFEENGYKEPEELLSVIKTAIENNDSKAIRYLFHSKAKEFCDFLEVGSYAACDAESFNKLLAEHGPITQEVIIQYDKQFHLEFINEVNELVAESNLPIEQDGIMYYRIDMNGGADDESVVLCKENGVWKILIMFLCV